MILAISASFRPSSFSFPMALDFVSAAAACSAVGSGTGGYYISEMSRRMFRRYGH